METMVTTLHYTRTHMHITQLVFSHLLALIIIARNISHQQYAQTKYIALSGVPSNGRELLQTATEMHRRKLHSIYFSVVGKNAGLIDTTDVVTTYVVCL